MWSLSPEQGRAAPGRYSTVLLRRSNNVIWSSEQANCHALEISQVRGKWNCKRRVPVFSIVTSNVGSSPI